MAMKDFHIVLIYSLICFNCFSQNSADSSINIFFKTNGFDLDTRQLDTIQRFLLAYPDITSIRGYADTTGPYSYNLALSKKRAFSVYNAVKGRSSSVKTNIVNYYGGSNSLRELWMNRRVELGAHKSASQSKEKDAISQRSDTTLVTVDSVYERRDTLRVINLQDLYFYPDRAILTNESFPYLQELAEQLKAYPSATFDIIGHINYQSRLDSTHLKDLYRLSEQRAKAVYDYLTEHGIPAAKMKYKGVGNSQPLIAAPRNDDERRKNMRVQVIIIRK